MVRGRSIIRSGRSAALTPEEIKSAFRVARSLKNHADRAVIVLTLSIELGVRASELAALCWLDVFDEYERLRSDLMIRAAYGNGRTCRIPLASPKLRALLIEYREKNRLAALSGDAPLFPSRRGGHMTITSMARFMTSVYRRAGMADASSRAGRRTFLLPLEQLNNRA